MIFVGAGTAINVIAVLVGAFVGIAVGRFVSVKLRELITDGLGLVTMLGAIASGVAVASAAFTSAIPNGATSMVVLASILIGGILGHLLRLEDRLEAFGEILKRRFGASGDNRFVEGFVNASLIFVIGPLAIMGAISDGLGTGIDQLLLKSGLDLFAAIAFASSLGIGVAASAIPVGIYQGAWTLVGVGLGNILSEAQVDAMTATGALLLGAIALRLLRIREIAVGSLLPALFVAPIITGFFQG